MSSFLRGLAFVGQTYCVVHLVREYCLEITLVLTGKFMDRWTSGIEPFLSFLFLFFLFSLNFLWNLHSLSVMVHPCYQLLMSVEMW